MLNLLGLIQACQSCVYFLMMWVGQCFTLICYVVAVVCDTALVISSEISGSAGWTLKAAGGLVCGLSAGQRSTGSDNCVPQRRQTKKKTIRQI